MPWTVADVDKHKKGLTSTQKKKWVSVANSILKDCQSKKGKDCEGKAIRIANSKFSEEIIMEKKTLKIPVGALRFESPESHAHCEFIDGEEKTPQMNMVIYSGKIISDHYYWDDLAIDLSGMVFNKSKYPILESHDTSKKIAFTGKPIVTPENTLTINPKKTFFVDTKESKEFQNLSKDGFPYESSVYVTPLSIERLDKGVSTEVNGFTMKGPCTIFRKSRFNEASVCVFGYDRYTQASAFAKEEVDIELEEERLSLVQDNINNKNGKEVKEVPIENITQLTEEYPELVAQIQAAIKTELESAFATERTALQAQITSKDEIISGQNDRVLKLEKSETIRTERELKALANSIWTAKLAESDVPVHLYDKVQNQIPYSKFVKDTVLDKVAFSAAIDVEIKDWVDKGVVVSSVMGIGGSTDTDAISATALEQKKTEENNQKIAENLLSHIGQKPPEKKKEA